MGMAVDSIDKDVIGYLLIHSVLLFLSLCFPLLLQYMFINASQYTLKCVYDLNVKSTQNSVIQSIKPGESTKAVAQAISIIPFSTVLRPLEKSNLNTHTYISMYCNNEVIVLIQFNCIHLTNIAVSSSVYANAFGSSTRTTYKHIDT